MVLVVVFAGKGNLVDAGREPVCDQGAGDRVSVGFVEEDDVDLDLDGISFDD